MNFIKRMFTLSFVAVGVFVLLRLFIRHTAPPFSEGWLAQIVFGLLFIIVGSFAFYSTNKMLRTAEKSKAALKTYPQQPWLARNDWRQGYAESESAMLSYMYLVMGLAFSLIILPFSGKLITALQQGHWQVSFMLMFPLAGTGFLIAFVREMMRFRRYGQSRFEFTPPISLGSHLTGKITMKGMALLNQPATVVVSCRKVVQPPGAGTQSSTVSNNTYKILWKGSCTSTGRPDDRGVALPVDIPLPYDAEASTDNTRISFIEWVLNVTSHVAGADFSGVYSIPVYQTGKGNPALTMASLHTEEMKSYETVNPNQFKSFTTQQTAAGLQVITRRGLAWLNSVIGIIVSPLLFAFFTFLIGKFIQSTDGNVITGAFLFAIFDSLPIVAFIGSIFGLFSKTTLTFGPQSLSVRKFGLIPSSKSYPYRAINSVDVDAMGSSPSASLYYLKLNLDIAGKSKHKRVLFCRQEEETKWLVAQLETHLPNTRSRK